MTSFSLSDELDRWSKLAIKIGLTERQICKLLDQKHVVSPKKNKCHNALGVVAIIACLFVAATAWFLSDIDKRFTLEDAVEYITSETCLISNNLLVAEIFRPPMVCDACKDLSSIPIVDFISEEEFVENHAYSGRPILVKKASANWTAMDTFSFDFFRELYKKNPKSLEYVENSCDFLGYNTEFLTLSDVFEMDDDRISLKPGEKHWYIGWCNSDSRVAEGLRKHYQTPSFIPQGSQSSRLDWIFMGGPGEGADIHIDNVEKPSWQAQISGSKTWTLIPPPECEHVCKSMNVTLTKGDIFVVDTNQWYHKTDIHPGEISITIGTEYD